jgi:hypothetical protein
MRPSDGMLVSEAAVTHGGWEPGLSIYALPQGG